MSFYGIVGLLTWFGGEQLGLSVNFRIVTLIVLLCTLPFTLLIGYFVSKQAEKKEEKKDAEENKPEKAQEKSGDSGEKPQKLVAPSGQYDDLSKGAEEVIQFLKASNLNVNGREAIYSLPWYIVAGMPKAGKSSLVIGSNLNSQTLPSQRQSEIKVIRPTRSVDWRVTSDAVFVDTAGRYQTEGNDQDEWASMLETIKKIRPNRPLDGYLLTANLERILNADEREVEAMAKVMRARLDEAIQRLKVRFPVYLIFTHADAIEGFRDSFSTSKKEGQKLVWGATIPLEKSEQAHALFDEEFGLLYNSVMKRRLMRLSAPFPPIRQLRIFNFPLHFGAARRKIGAFVNTLFRPNPFTENPFLRGYYFTAVPANRPLSQGPNTPPNLPQTVGVTYFTEKLFRDVILRDKDLVKTFQEQRQRPPVLGWLLILFGTILTLLFLILAAISLVSNKQMLDDVSEKGVALINAAKADDVNREILAMENLRADMVKLDDYERNGAPIYMGMGLYSGNRLYRDHLLPIYYASINRRFMAATVAAIEEDLKKFVSSPPVKNASQLSPEEEDFLGKNYDLLKVYLMLTEQYREKSNETEIINTLKDYWFKASKLPESQKDLAENQLKFYARQVDRMEGPGRFPRLPLDSNAQKLVAEVRARLNVFPAWQRYYRRKATEISNEVEANSGKMSAEEILQRKGGDAEFMQGSYVVPGAYTLEGFKKMEKAILTSGTELSSCDWVVKEKCDATTQVAETIASTETTEIRKRYFRDYTDHWKNFVKGLKVKPYRKENTTEPGKVSPKEALASFSTKNSPMRILLEEVVKHTNLAKKPSLTWWESIKNWFSSEGIPESGADSQVVREFVPLFSFVEAPKDKAAPIDDYGKAIENVSNAYSRFFDDNKLNELSAKPEEERNKEIGINRATEAINSLTKPLKDMPFIVDLLKQPIDNLKALFGADTIKQIGERWKNEIVPLARKAEQGYPFESGETNADFTNLREYLAKGKGLSKFYEETLKKYFDGTPGQLKPKDPNNFPFNNEFLDYLNKALTLREALFSKGDDVKFSYNFELLNPNDALVEITIDGVTISSVEKPSSPIDFPAGSGMGSGVIIKARSTTGTTSTSGTSANNFSSSVNSSNTSNSVTNRFLQNSNSSSSGDEKSFPGPWGLFRFMDAASATKEADKVYKLSYRLRNGKVIEAKITAQGVDPFNKEIYKLRAPENILK